MWWFVLAACTPAEPPPAPEVAPAEAPPPEEPVSTVEPPRCPEVFTEAHSNAIYGKLSGVEGEDGCAFDAVRTRSSVVGLEWKKGSKVIAWTLEPAACAEAATVTEGGLALTADDAARDACPKAWESTVALMKSSGLPTPASP